MAIGNNNQIEKRLWDAAVNKVVKETTERLSLEANNKEELLKK